MCDKAFATLFPVPLNRISLQSKHLLVAPRNMANPLTGPSALRDIINPQFHQNNFPEELFIKNELGIKLDKGTADYCALVISFICV